MNVILNSVYQLRFISIDYFGITQNGGRYSKSGGRTTKSVDVSVWIRITHVVINFNVYWHWTRDLISSFI